MSQFAQAVIYSCCPGMIISSPPSLGLMADHFHKLTEVNFQSQYLLPPKKVHHKCMLSKYYKIKINIQNILNLSKYIK